MLQKKKSIHEVLVARLKKEIVDVDWSDILRLCMKTASLSLAKEAFEGMWEKSIPSIESANRNK